VCRDCGCSLAPERQPTLGLKEQMAGLTLSATKKISVEESVYQKNQLLAQKNQKRFLEVGLKVFNVMSSPGSGKTTLLSKILSQKELASNTLVIVGDQETDIDAKRFKNAGVRAVQINTKSACHLDAERVANVIGAENLDGVSWLVIENVGNLVCPAAFDLGEQLKVAVLSVTEGEEKPLKYPALFQDADLVVISKCDLLPYLQYDKELLLSNIKKQNSRAPILFVSAVTGEGLSLLSQKMRELQCV
jgi:hydrogenase nickel incorporation protein HypB